MSGDIKKGPVEMGYYDFLGVNSDADARELRTAYLKLAKTLHPDSATGSVELMQELIRIYHVLKNPAKRALYDAQGAAAFEAAQAQGEANSARTEMLMQVNVILTATIQQAFAEAIQAAVERGYKPFKGQMVSDPLPFARKALLRDCEGMERELKKFAPAYAQLDAFRENLEFNPTGASLEDMKDAPELAEDSPDLLGSIFKSALNALQEQEHATKEKLRYTRIALVYLKNYSWKLVPEQKEAKTTSSYYRFI